jgi:hypothetical protein
MSIMLIMIEVMRPWRSYEWPLNLVAHAWCTYTGSGNSFGTNGLKQSVVHVCTQGMSEEQRLAVAFRAEKLKTLAAAAAALRTAAAASGPL